MEKGYLESRDNRKGERDLLKEDGPVDVAGQKSAFVEVD
jgi:hypothetical protein